MSSLLMKVTTAPERLGGTVTEASFRAKACRGLLELVPQAKTGRVASAHLTGQPLNRQLRERGGRLVYSTRTAPIYRLYAVPDTFPPKPGLLRSGGDGHAIEVEVWELPLRAYGDFVREIPSPHVIGTLELEDGERVQGFL